MNTDEWSFEANMKRGTLPTGEALEALYGTGPWTRQPEPDWAHRVVQCHVCDGRAYDLGDEIDCENCGVIQKCTLDATTCKHHDNGCQVCGGVGSP